MSFLLDKLGLPQPSQLFSQLGGGLGNVRQSLQSGFGGFMQSLPFQMAPGTFPGTTVGPGTPAATAPTQGGGAPVANTPGSPTPTPSTGAPGALPSITTPGGLTITPPTLPFSNNAAAPVANMQPGNGGLLGTANNLLSSVGNTVASLLNPRGAAPANVPNMPSPATGGAPPTPTTPQAMPNGITSNVLATAAQVVRTVTGNLPGVVAPQAGAVASQSGAQAPLTAGMQAPQAAPAQQSTPGQPLMAANPGQAIPAQQASTLAPQAQTLPQQAGQSALPQQSAQAPLAPQGQAMRADAAFAPAGNPAADRAALLQQAQQPVQPGIQNAPAATTLLAAVPMATTVAQAPIAQQLAGNPQAQATGGPQAGTAALDAGGPVRAEMTGTGTYTAEGPGLRRRERMKVGAQQMGPWMLAAMKGQLHLVRPHDDSRHEAERVFQWLFWVLAIVAYGSLGLVLVAFLLSFGELPAAPALRRWTGEFAFTGLLAAIGAWWLGRQLTRAARPPPDPIRR